MSSQCYKKYLRLKPDLSPLDILPIGTNDTAYFCTPKGYSLIGRAGVDGIHYCFVRGFGDMVFIVSPSNGPGEYVHPVSDTFEDFLRLVLACGGCAAVEQAWQWDEKTFAQFLADYPPDEEQRAAMEHLAKTMGLTPMEEPYQYMRAIQDNFDYKKLKCNKKYEEYIKEGEGFPADLPWQVFFEEHHSRDLPGVEICTEKEFRWGERDFRIPAVYLCEKGLVIDFCMRAPYERVEEFQARWNEMEQNEAVDFTPELRRELSRENPMNLDFRPEVLVNGRTTRWCRGSSRLWIPNCPEYCEKEARDAVLHHGLDMHACWRINRCWFPWTTKKRPVLKKLSVRLEQEPVEYLGTHFTVSQEGDTVELVHPVTGEKCVLQVVEYRPETMDHAVICDGKYEVPRCFWSMGYTLEPPIPPENFYVQDCAEGEALRPVFVEKEDETASAIAIIGGVDGPVAFCTGNDTSSEVRTVLSAAHYEPVEQVEWRTVFRMKELEDIQVELID